MQLDLATIIQLGNLAGFVFLVGKVFYKEGARDTTLASVVKSSKENAEELQDLKGLMQLMEKALERQIAILERLEQSVGIIRERSHKDASILSAHEEKLATMGNTLEIIEGRLHEHEIAQDGR